MVRCDYKIYIVILNSYIDERMHKLEKYVQLLKKVILNVAYVC